MTRYRNVNSGAIVSVRDDKVLGSEWEAQPESKPAQKKSTPKSDK